MCGVCIKKKYNRPFFNGFFSTCLVLEETKTRQKIKT